jgi:hypothetical protein
MYELDCFLSEEIPSPSTFLLRVRNDTQVVSQKSHSKKITLKSVPTASKVSSYVILTSTFSQYRALQ